jgi:hypothetical protein
MASLWEKVWNSCSPVFGSIAANPPLRKPPAYIRWSGPSDRAVMSIGSPRTAVWTNVGRRDVESVCGVELVDPGVRGDVPYVQRARTRRAEADVEVAAHGVDVVGPLAGRVEAVGQREPPGRAGLGVDLEDGGGRLGARVDLATRDRDAAHVGVVGRQPAVVAHPGRGVVAEQPPTG